MTNLAIISASSMRMTRKVTRTARDEDGRRCYFASSLRIDCNSRRRFAVLLG